MKMMNKSIFVDTNVLVYAETKTSPFYQSAKQKLNHYLNLHDNLWISRQVIREYMAKLSRSQNFSNPVPANQLAADIHKFTQIFSVLNNNYSTINFVLTKGWAKC